MQTEETLGLSGRASIAVHAVPVQGVSQAVAALVPAVAGGTLCLAMSQVALTLTHVLAAVSSYVCPSPGVPLGCSVLLLPQPGPCLPCGQARWALICRGWRRSGALAHI